MMHIHAMMLTQSLFARLLAFAPEALQQEARRKVFRIIPACCLTEEDLRRSFAEEDAWEDLSEAEQASAIEALLDAPQFEAVASAARRAIDDAVGNYLADVLLEKELDAEGDALEE